MSTAANLDRRPRLNGAERRLIEGLFQSLLQDVAAQVTRAFVRRAADRATAHPRAAAGVLMPMLATMVGPSDRYLADFLTSAGLARRHAELVRIAARLLVETYAGARKGTPESADALVRAIYAEVVSGFSWGRRQP